LLQHSIEFGGKPLESGKEPSHVQEPAQFTQKAGDQVRPFEKENAAAEDRGKGGQERKQVSAALSRHHAFKATQGDEK